MTPRFEWENYHVRCHCGRCCSTLVLVSRVKNKNDFVNMTTKHFAVGTDVNQLQMLLSMWQRVVYWIICETDILKKDPSGKYHCQHFLCLCMFTWSAFKPSASHGITRQWTHCVFSYAAFWKIPFQFFWIVFLSYCISQWGIDFSTQTKQGWKWVSASHSGSWLWG